jgi:hypothetical protein
MKKLNYLWMIAAVLIFSSCNGSLEERVRDLEARVAVLEAGGTPPRVSTPPATATPDATAEPEVRPEGPLPAFDWEVDEHDFGTITDGDIVEKKFAFTNVGDAPLIITNAKATCGCTVPEWPKDPIPVGETGEILVRFNSRNKTGNQMKTITVTANTFPSDNRVQIRANVVAAAE